MAELTAMHVLAGPRNTSNRLSEGSRHLTESAFTLSELSAAVPSSKYDC
ncbi:hypothetical protein IG631_15579 [Alternaria alternata]|jgi:hypothetical protein|nr:hypothetical protein IG631_15579 [Alternaria alternata]